MCARRFLMVILVLTLIAVAAGFAIFRWGGSVLVRQATPKGHFEAAAAGGGPDYARAESWLARPRGDPAVVEWKPANAGPLPDGPRDAAIFYLHPTTYLDPDRWNAPLEDSGETAFRTNLFLQSQASAFADLGELWAPRYRQAAFGAFLLKSEDAEAALNLAYRDVAAAFDEFARRTGDKPIILAGHSQGALHLERLLREKIAGKPVAKRVVAAYVVGWPISTAVDLPALGLPPCTAPDQARCILSWMTFAEPSNPDFILDQWEKSKGLIGGKRRQEDALCVNPISGVENGAAAPADNPGTLVPSADLGSATLAAGAVGAHCDKGLLILDGALPPLGPYTLPGNNYHVYDYALFWGAVRRDAARRLAAWHR